MTEPSWKVLEEAHRALRGGVAGVKPADWQAPTPCEGWNFTQMLQCAAGDQLGYASKPDPATSLFDFLGRRADWVP